MASLKRLIFWEYKRGSWQYDIIVALILAFIFLTPKQWFRDQPRIPQASQVTSLPSHGESVFWIEPELLATMPEAGRLEQLGKILTSRTGKSQILTRIEPIYDAEKELKGYMAFARP